MARARRDGTKRESEMEKERAPSDEEGGVIDKTGRSGVVRTEHGVTSVGTTPIREGSVEPVGHHREAAARIMGKESADVQAAAEEDRHDERSR